MSRAFADLAFTPAVKAAQTRYGSRALNQRIESAHDRHDTLGVAEREFIEQRDGFYQATVSESGWPYVQFRGGPAGFLKVIDLKTIGYADFRGNVQYLSAGNLDADGRVALILMDYANRRRLKIWGKARIVDAAEDPTLVDSLKIPTYRARVERAIIIGVEAFDWNCPQHITRRFTEEEVQTAIAPLLAELEDLRARLARGEAANAETDKESAGQNQSD
ncbi:MAG: pyridoxamine 5'-phosphate oxidase family protein [Dokdonella sp.]